METDRIGIREFRDNLAGYLESGRPLAITRHGETPGFYIPARKHSRKAEVEAMRAAAKERDALIAAWGRVGGRTHEGRQRDPARRSRKETEQEISGMKRKALVPDVNIPAESRSSYFKQRWRKLRSTEPNWFQNVAAIPTKGGLL